MTTQADQEREQLLTWAHCGMNGDSKSFAGVIAISGRATSKLARDVPALYEAYAKLESSLRKDADVVNLTGKNIAVSQDSTDSFILPPGIPRRVLWDETTKRVLLLEHIPQGMLPYLAQWTCEIAFSMPVMSSASQAINFDPKQSAGTLGTFFTIEDQYGPRILMPEWYGAFWKDSNVQQCTVFPTLRSVFTSIPNDIEWVDAIVSSIQSANLVPSPSYWPNNSTTSSNALIHVSP